MRKTVDNVEKSDIGFLDTVKDRFLELGGRLTMSKTRTKSTFSGYGVKVSRETETITAGAQEDDCDEG